MTFSLPHRLREGTLIPKGNQRIGGRSMGDRPCPMQYVFARLALGRLHEGECYYIMLCRVVTGSKGEVALE